MVYFCDRSNRRKYHVVYKTTCLVTGRYYIGLHSTDELDDGYLGSGNMMMHSIQEHGSHNHRREILKSCSSRQEAADWEAHYVTEDVVNDSESMNVSIGGGSGSVWPRNPSEAWKRKYGYKGIRHWQAIAESRRRERQALIKQRQALIKQRQALIKPGTFREKASRAGWVESIDKDSAKS